MALSSIFSKAVSSVKDAVRNVTPAAKNAVATASNMAKRFAPKAYSWDGKSASQMSTLEKTAYLRMNGQKTGAREAFNALADEMRSASSRHYSPYLTGKSNQKEAMEFFGLDRFDQDWLDNNRFLLNYTNQLDWTDTISTSGQAKWSNAQKAGYYWQMLNEAEKTTQEAEQEWKSLRASMQENFNEYKRLYGEAPSYDKLMSYINMNDYGTLQKMDKVYDNVEDLVRLNRSVDYTPETMVGVYAALLNGKDVTGDGDWFEEAVQYTMQPKALPRKQEERLAYSGWTQQQIDQKREEIRRNGTRKQLMEFEADLYASTPHLDSVDSESYFKEAYYDQKFLDKYAYLGGYAEQLRNREGKIEKPASGDPWWYGAAYEYGNIKDREAVTAAAEKEWDALRKSLAEAYDPEADPEDVIAFIDWEQYPTLDKLRKGQDVDLNRPVYFSEDALRGVLKAAADGEKTSKDDFDYAYYTTPEAAPRAQHETPEQPTWWTKIMDAALGKGEDGESVSHNHVQTLVDELGYSEGVAQARNMATYLRQSGDVEAAEKLEKQIEEVVRPEETPEPTSEELVRQRTSFMDQLWKDMTGKKTTDAMAIEKAFYEQNGRPMTTMEREQYGLAPVTIDQVPYIEPVLGQMTVEKQSIFTDEMNAAASKMINPKTGEGYANMDELLANDPAALGNMLNYIEAEPEKQTFTQNEVAHLRMLKQYQDKVDSEAIDELFRVYADDNAIEEDRLRASLQYIVQSGLTLDEKERLGLLDTSLTSGESLQLMAQRSQELMVERGDEFSRAMAIAMLPKDAPEWLVNTVDAGISHLFAVETGIAGGVLKTQAAGFNVARDLWSAVNVLHYAVRLGTDYTLDEACEIDPILRGLTAATDQVNTLTSVAAPDMSNYSYGAGFTQFIVDSAVGQKTANFYAPAGKSFVSTAMKKLGLGDLGVMMASDNKLYRFVGKAIDSAAGATPWMLRSMSDGAQEARDMGASEADAIRYGAWTGGTTGFIEGVLGQAYDGLLDKGNSMISKGIGKICKGGMKNLAESKGFVYVTNLLQQAMGESAEGLAEMPLEKAGRSMFLGENFAITGKDWSEAWENARLEGVASIFTSLFFGLTADRDSKIYTDSERFADRLVNGEVNIDEVIEYIADPEAVPAPREVREAARVIEENQGAVDEAAVEMAAEEVVAQQIDAGALDDINGEASANAQAMRTQEADVQTAQQEVDDLALQIEETDNQKRAALYDMVSNGISSAKGAARQLIHNLDEAKAALVRRQQEASEKLAEKQKTLQLKVEEVDAQIAERLKELKAAAAEQKLKELLAARKKADEAIRAMQKAMESEESSEVSGRTAAADRRVYSEDVSDNLVDQIIGVDAEGDFYAPFSAESKENPQFESQAEANRAAHYAGTDVVPDVSLDDEGDGFFTVSREQYDKYDMLLNELPKEGFTLDKGALMHREYDEDNRAEDPIANATDRALVTVARTGDNEYVLVKDTERANRGEGDAYLLMRRPDFATQTGDSSVNQEASNILDAIDARLAELDQNADELKKQGIYGVDIDQTEERIAALEKLRKTAGEYVRSGRQRALLDRFEQLAANEGRKGLAAEELRTVMNNLPETEPSTSFNLDDYVVGRFGRQNEAIQAIVRMGKNVQRVSGGKPSYRISLDLLNAIPDPEQFISELDTFDLNAFAEANPGLFGAASESGESWKPEDLSVRYESKLANNNPNYAVVDSSGGFNLVVPKRHMQLDANNTGRDENVNRGIATVTDAINALEAELSKDAEQIADERTKGYSRKHDPMRIIYTTYDENGQPVNKTYLDYVDPKTGEPRVPTVRELLANSSRVTVNWVREWNQANPNEGPRPNPETGKIMYNNRGNAVDPDTGKPWRPKSIPGEKLSFTLERNDLAPNAYDPTSPNASMILMQADLRRAEADYNRHVGEEASLRSKLIYFKRVCEANFNSYVRAINELNIRMSNPGLTDAELATVQQRAEECREALNTWRYVADRVDEAMKAKGTNALKTTGIERVLDKYNELTADGGNASLQSRTAMAALLRHSMLMDQMRQAEAELPTDATIQSLEAKRAELTAALEQVMNSRNQPPVAGMATPSATNNEPLTQAIMEAVDIVDRQIEIVSSRPAEEPQTAPEAAAEEVQAPEEKPVESPSAAPDEVSQNPENVTDAKAEEADTVTKQQEMDRAYLEAVVNPEPEAEEKPDMVDMETGEFVKNDEAVSGEFANAETGEIEYREDIPAEELSWTAPVEEYMKRAGLERDYPGVVITSPESHEQVENLANKATDAVRYLTDRIDGMQTVLSSEIGDADFRKAVETEKRRYIDERNRIKARMKHYSGQLSDSEYISEKSINNIVRHCLETGDVDWETPLVRSKKIDEIRVREIDGIRKRMAERMKDRQDTALSIDDVAYILETKEMRQTLTRRNQVAWALRAHVRRLSEAIEDAEKGAERIREENEKDGETTDRMTQLARLDEYLLRARTQLENGQKAMRMYFDSGSNASLRDILSGKTGGKYPIPVMNRLFAMLQEEASNRKRSTNRIGLLNNINNPLRTVEFFTGEFAPVFNAMYIDSALQKNAAMATEKDELIGILENVDIPKRYEEIAFLYAEGKITEEQLEDRVTNLLDRTKIRSGVEAYKQLYERLLKEVNEALVRNGFDPIKERSHYVHHMREAQGLIGKVCSNLGIHISDDVLPTSFAGKTEELKPRRKFADFALERKGDETSHKLLHNTVSYIESALRVIHHTDNISRLRQLEGVSLETQNKAPVYSGIRQYGELVVHDEKTVDRPRETYSSFAEWISRYADGLAGKKTGKLDRATESSFGRNALQVINGLKRLNGSAYTAYSPKVAISNVLPVGMMTVVSPVKTAAALLETHKAFRDHEVYNFEAGSSFLTSRFGGKGMSETWLDKFMEKGYVMSEAVDRFAAHTVVRSFYKVGREKGWSHTEAMRWADQMAWRMMGSKKVGEGSNTMNSTVSSTLLQFSNESINTLQFLMHDLPRYHGGDKKKTALSLFWLMIVNFLYNGLLSTDTAPEVITPAIRSAREWDSEESVGKNLKNAVGNYAEALNPTNIATGGSYGDGILESVPLVSAVKDALTADEVDDFLTACLDFVPASATVNRTLTAAGDLLRGYSVDSKGNIKYTLNTDEFSAGTVFDVIASMIFGSNSSIGGREYKAGGSKAMTSTQTEAFHNQKEQGKSNQEAYDAVKEYADKRGDNRADSMILPDWATAEVDSDWMQAVIADGTAAYPSEAPDSLTIDGVKYELSDEEKTAFDSSYKTAYKMRIQGAMKRGESLKKAADKAYRAALNRFKEKLEG